MDTVNVKGINYEKASLLAKEFKYTSDYLGQLCRARKVDCQLIGRTWYINRDSLVSHRNSRYSKNNTLSDEKTFEYNVKINKSRVEIEPFLKNKVIKMTASRTGHFNDETNWKPAKYELDKGDLLPTMLDKSRKMKADIIETKPEKHLDNSVKSEIEFRNSPSVVLNGDIKISSQEYEHETEKTLLDKKNIDILDERGSKSTEKVHYITKSEENIQSPETEVSEISLIPKKVKQIKKQKERSKSRKWLSFTFILLLTATYFLL